VERGGLRLQGPALAHASLDRAEIVSQGMAWGAVQVPPNGQPIALLADYQTVGGYPVLAVVIRADWPRLGQLRPGSRLRFGLVSLEEAQAACRVQQEALDRAAAALGRTDQWETLVEAAEG
jgi:allophanate hydrolase subunit 2